MVHGMKEGMILKWLCMIATKAVHIRFIADCLGNLLPDPDQDYFLYCISMSPG